MHRVEKRMDSTFPGDVLSLAQRFTQKTGQDSCTASGEQSSSAAPEEAPSREKPR